MRNTSIHCTTVFGFTISITLDRHSNYYDILFSLNRIKQKKAFLSKIFQEMKTKLNFMCVLG